MKEALRVLQRRPEMHPSEQANLPRWRGRAGFFEIWFAVIFDPRLPRAYWFRYTLMYPAAGRDDAARAIVWATAFEHGPTRRPIAVKRLHPIGDFDRGPHDRFHVRIGDAAIGHGFLRGDAAAGGHALAWDLRFEPARAPARRTPALLDRLPLPTHASHTNADVRFSGEVTVDGERRALENATGTQMHLHGTRQVEELYWIYATAFDDDPRALLEIVSPRLDRRAAGLPAPRIISRYACTREGEHDRTALRDALGARLDLPGPGLLDVSERAPREAALVRAFAPPDTFAGFVYRDPVGREVHVAQSDVASVVTERFARPHPLAPWRPTSQHTSRRRAALEIHQPEALPGVAYIPWDATYAPPTTHAPTPAPGPADEGPRALSAPREVFALGLTWKDHIRETGGNPSRPARPVVFAKHPRAWLPQGDVVRVPSTEEMLAALAALEPGIDARLRARYGFLPALMDYEVELGFVLEEPVTRAALRDASARAPRLSWFLANDLTARACQVLGEGRPDAMAYWSLAKSFPGFLPVSPRAVELSDAPAGAWPALTITTRVNGIVRQRGDVRDIAFTPRDLLTVVADAAGRDLRAGDTILTGTPPGVAFRVPSWKRRLGDLLLDRFGKLDAAIGMHVRGAGFLRPGDHVEVDGGPLGRRAITLDV